jgi:hypothetical protein
MLCSKMWKIGHLQLKSLWAAISLNLAADSDGLAPPVLFQIDNHNHRIS